MPGMDYTLFYAGSDMAAGLMEQPEDARKMGAPPSWLGYVGVDDVDAATAKAKGLGATVYVEPRDIPNVGRFSVIADPQMARDPPVHAFRPAAGPASAGHAGPHRMARAVGRRLGEGLAFYAEMFGWQKADAVDMGPMGTYQLFGKGGPAIGGMFNKPPEVPACFWLYYFNVPDIDAASGTGEVRRWRSRHGPDAGAGRRLDRPGQRPARRHVRSGGQAAGRKLVTSSRPRIQGRRRRRLSLNRRRRRRRSAAG